VLLYTTKVACPDFFAAIQPRQHGMESVLMPEPVYQNMNARAGRIPAPIEERVTRTTRRAG
jgi:hypothetical protein